MNLINNSNIEENILKYGILTFGPYFTKMSEYIIFKETKNINPLRIKIENILFSYNNFKNTEKNILNLPDYYDLVFLDTIITFYIEENEDRNS